MKGFRVWSNYWKKYAIEAELYMDGSVDAIFEDADGVPHHENTDLVVEFDTGLKDKNGKEIYEGDIVRLYDRFVSVITWQDNYCGFRWYDKGDGYCGLGRNNEEYYEVIGNIHENGILLGDTNVANEEEE